MSVSAILDPESAQINLNNLEKKVSEGLLEERNLVVYTSRVLRTGSSDAENLRISQRVSDYLVSLVQRLKVCPRFIVAKGGITSSDLATKALGIRRAVVKGQIIPGVPVWELGRESLYPGLSYVVFPGNVGNEAALWEVLQKLVSEV